LFAGHSAFGTISAGGAGIKANILGFSFDLIDFASQGQPISSELKEQRLQAIDQLSEQITDSGLQEQKIKPLVEQLQEAKNLETLYGTENAAEVSNLKTSVVVYEIKDKLVEVGRDQLAQDLENLHGGLNVAGFVPGIGEPFDILNGIVYSLEGKPIDAGLSYLSAVPVWGYAANAGKGVKYGAEFTQGAGKFGDEIFDLPAKGKIGWNKLKGSQGWKDSSGNIWKKDQLHKDHWDISDSKGNKIMEVDYQGNKIWPGGPKNKNKLP
jgi:hypothetical protein